MKAGNMGHIISAISHLSLPELEQVFDHVLALQAERKPRSPAPPLAQANPLRSVSRK